MDLVYYINFVTGWLRREENFFFDCSYIIDRCIWCSVDFNDIDTGSRCNLTAWGALSARMCAHSPFTVESFSQKSGWACFSYASWTRKKISMGNSALLDCILQCGHNKFLPYKFFKILRSFPGCGNFVSHRIMIASKTPWDYLVRKNRWKNQNDNPYSYL